MTPLRDVRRTLVRHVPWSYMLDHMGPSSQRLQETSSRRQKGTFLGVTYRAIWRRPQDAIFQRPKDVCRGRLQDVGRRLPLALHWGPYGTSIGRLLPSVIFRHNFAEWVGSKKKFLQTWNSFRDNSGSLIAQFKQQGPTKSALSLTFRRNEWQLLTSSMAVFSCFLVISV